MKREAVRETLGFLGVIASLMFVGLEVRQNTLATRAAAYQEIGASLSGLWQDMAQDPELAHLVMSRFDGERPLGSLSEPELDRMRTVTIAAVRQYEVIWRQVELGLLPGEVLTYFGWAPSEFASGDIWPEVRNHLSSDFRDYLEQAAAGQ